MRNGLDHGRGGGGKEPGGAPSLEGIESRISDIVGNKRAFFRGLFDGTSDEVTFETSGGFVSRLEKVIEPAIVSKLEEEDPAGERELDEMVAAGDESRDRPAETPDVRKLFAGVRMKKTRKGGLVIEAEPEAAAVLAAVFEGMAKMLRGGNGSRR